MYFLNLKLFLKTTFGGVGGGGMSETDVFCACVRGTQVHAHASIINSVICRSALQLSNILGCRAYGESSGTKNFLQTGNL